MILSNKFKSDFSKRIFFQKIQTLKELDYIYFDEESKNKSELYHFTVFKSVESLFKKEINNISEIVNSLYAMRSGKVTLSGKLAEKNKRYMLKHLDILINLKMYTGKISNIEYSKMNAWGAGSFPSGRGISDRKIMEIVDSINIDKVNVSHIKSFFENNSKGRHKIAHGISNKYDNSIVVPNIYPKEFRKVIEDTYSLFYDFYKEFFNLLAIAMPF